MKELHNDTPAPSFGERYAYVIWLRAAGRLNAEGDNDVAAGADVTRQWIQKWRRRDQAPNERLMTRNLVRFLENPIGPLEDWLLDGVGEPPRPELWQVWSEARRQLLAAEGKAPAAKKRGAVVDLEGGAVVPAPRRSAAVPEKKRRRA